MRSRTDEPREFPFLRAKWIYISAWLVDLVRESLALSPPTKGDVEMDQLIQAVPQDVGMFSFADGFIAARTSLFDELRQNPTAVFNRLCNTEQWDTAEWVLDNFFS